MAIFEESYLENENGYQKSLFEILYPFSAINAMSDFPYLDSFALKMAPEHREGKKSHFWFFNFLLLGWSDLLHVAQIEDHESVLEWRFDSISGLYLWTF